VAEASLNNLAADKICGLLSDVEGMLGADALYLNGPMTYLIEARFLRVS